MHTISWGHIAGDINLLDNVALVFYIMLKKSQKFNNLNKYKYGSRVITQ